MVELQMIKSLAVMEPKVIMKGLRNEVLHLFADDAILHVWIYTVLISILSVYDLTHIQQKWQYKPNFNRYWLTDLLLWAGLPVWIF